MQFLSELKRYNKEMLHLHLAVLPKLALEDKLKRRGFVLDTICTDRVTL
jgi:hypothetical protein